MHDVTFFFNFSFHQRTDKHTKQTL